jgi:ribosome-binding factor A
MQEIDRTRRVAELIKREIAFIISNDLNDKRINSVTLTSVTVSKDLCYATIYFSTISEELDSDKVEKLLNNSSKFLRHRLGKIIEMRITPTLVFKYDNSLKRGAEMSALIDSLNKKNG